MKVKTNPELFIIESITLKEEQKKFQEGHIISEMLNLAGKKKTRYYYIRTRLELEEMIEIFGKSKYRYLHLSCHADKSGLSTTFDAVSYSELGKMLKPHLLKRRVFVSACEMANRNLAEELFRDSGLISLTGPKKKIGFDDAAAFWVSFYHLMFKKDRKRMSTKDLRETTQQLSTMYDVHTNCFVALKGGLRFRFYSLSPS